MTANGILQIAIYFLLILALAKPVGVYMAKVFAGEKTFLHPLLRPLERLCYAIGGVREDTEQRWTQYAGSVLSLSFFSFLFVYLLQRLQGVLPLNPMGFSDAQPPAGATTMTPDLAFNTAVSFTTNTNWQAYVGETTLSYLVQMAALTVQNFVSAAAGVAIAIALVRGFARQQSNSIGNFWVDLTRAVVYLFLPLSLAGALFLCSQGVVQNLSPYTSATTVEGKTQTIAQGPVASQEAIKMIGTNGGGFFNANSSHPFENPTPLTNLVQMLMIFVIPAGLTYTFGRMVGDSRQGWALFAAMSVLFLIGAFVVYGAEQAGNPNLAGLGIEQSATAAHPGGNMEGKEVRFGIAATSLFATITTAASCGAVIGMHDSFTPLGGLIPLFNMQSGEVIFGGTGAGLYGMLLFAILAVFIAGLMVGRTPEYLGKKIEGKEVKMAMLALIATSAAILLFTGISSVVPFAKDAYWNGSYGAATGNLNNSGPHGFAEILYAYSSGAGNNGSAFAGISANTPWYNLTIGIAMLVGRFLIIIPMLAAAGSLASKKKLAVTSGTLPTHGPLFVTLLVGTVFIVGALTFFPALSLCPLVEHFTMHQGRLFSAMQTVEKNTVTGQVPPTPRGNGGDPTELLPKKLAHSRPLFDGEILRRAIADSFRKLNPVTLLKNPVIFVVEVGAVMTTILLFRDLATGSADVGFNIQIALWLWFTVLFANFAEAMAEARGKAQADTLRKTQTDSMARRMQGGKIETVTASQLRAGDLVICSAGEIIPGDGEVFEGIATVDESVITGESAPVIRESGGDRSAVTGGTRVLSDEIQIRITSNPGETFLDRMIALVEGAERQKTPNEIALNILIAGLTLIFLLAVVTLQPFSQYAVSAAGSGAVPSVAVLVSLLVCLIPTTIGGLLSAIGIAGMDRVMQHNVLAMSGKAVEAAGDVNTLLLDKTGTITIGNRQAVELIPVSGVTEKELAEAAQLSSLADETPEGRSVVVLAKEKYGLRGRELSHHEAHFIPFSAYTRMSGVDIDGKRLRKGATESILQFVKEQGGNASEELSGIAEKISRQGGTPLAVADGRRALGVIHLKDVVKGGMKERLAQLRQMGIQTVMITGDNPLTAAAIASEAGVDNFLAQASPADKLNYIKKEQAEGRLVAMTGDGTNDAPALAQADVGLAMNTGTMAAKEAGNMVDLDSNPTKLIEVVAIGKQLLITRGALTTFSIANDVAKYFAIIPAMFMATYPALGALNIMGLHSPKSAVLAAVIFNALIIIALVPLALRGVKYRPGSAGALLRRNLLVYGLGGIIVPFPGIWIIDQLVHVLGLA